MHGQPAVELVDTPTPHAFLWSIDADVHHSSRSWIVAQLKDPIREISILPFVPHVNHILRKMLPFDVLTNNDRSRNVPRNLHQN